MVDREEIMFKIVLRSSDSEALNRSIQKIVKIIRSHDGRAMTVDPVDGGLNGKGICGKIVGVFSPNQETIDDLMKLDLDPGVEYDVEI
jgi:ribosomal protein S10